MKLLFEDKKNLTESFTIDDMYAGAWNEAIEEIVNIINEELGQEVCSIQEWTPIENIASRLGVRFNENGEILR